MNLKIEEDNLSKSINDGELRNELETFSSTSVSLNNTQKKPRLPNFLILLAFAEMWERFSYYGMRALLVLYLTTHLGMTDTYSYGVYGLFASIGYLGSILFGILADRFFGPKYMVFVGGVTMLIGHGMMSLSDVYNSSVYLGLAAIAIGTGAFKGNITNMLGICYAKQNQRPDEGYTMFYTGVNIGSFFATTACGLMGTYIGWEYGFGLAGLGMSVGLVALIIYKEIISGIGEYPQNITKNILTKLKIGLFVSIILLIFVTSLILKNPNDFMGFFKVIAPISITYYVYIAFKSGPAYRTNLLILGFLLIFQMVFYALEMQTSGVIKIFASRNVDLTILGYKIPASTIDSINPLTIMIFGIIISTFIKFNYKRGDIRFAFGLSCIPICFILFYIGGIFANNGIVSPIYFVSGMVMMALGELFVNPYIQAQASMLAPQSHRGFIFGFIALMVSFANVIGAFAAQYMSIDSKDLTDPIKTLSIYQNGFEKIIIINLIMVGTFIALIPVIRFL